MNRKAILPAVLALAALAGCDSQSTAPAGERVSFNFTAATSAARLSSSAAPGLLVLEGDNGVLTLTDLRAVVSRFRLKGDDDINRCEDNGGGEQGRNRESVGHDGSPWSGPGRMPGVCLWLL